VSCDVAIPNEPANAGHSKDVLSRLMFQALEGLEFGIVIFDAEAAGHPVVYVNPAFQRITGFQVEDSLGRSCRLLDQNDGDKPTLATLRHALSACQPCRIELARMREDGSQGWIQFSLSPIRSEQGATTHLIGLVQDISAAKQTLAHLEQSESRLRTIMVSVEEGVQLWDADGRLIYANPASRRQLGMLVEGTAEDQEQPLLSGETAPLLDERFPDQHVLNTGQAEKDILMRLERPDGGQGWIRLNAHPILDQETGRLLGAVTSTSDVTDTVEQEQRLERLAHYDALTQLPNRVLLADRMRQTLARCQRTRETFAVGIMDLDGFKPVNDTYGHKAGDQVLREVADRLMALMREEDTVARMGGDEFALLLGGFATTQDCEKVLQRILNSVAAPYLVNGEVVRISTSIGVTLYPDDRSDPDKLLRHADQAMYQAKQDGKNRFEFFDSGLEQRHKANQCTLHKIGEALDRGEFVLHYQPVVDCRQGRVVGAEALVRWQHPILGLLSPAEFLPLIEQDDLIVALGEWAIAEALAQIGRWRELGLEIDVSVNVSARQLHQREFAGQIQGLLGKAADGIARRLDIEIVETAALEDINAVSELIERLRAMGVHIALDDFGTGYSSLIHLRRLAADTLKIDQSFVKDMLDDPLDLAIVEGVIGLATVFQYRVIAEGAESIDHILMLLELGCDHIQGYGIARPMAASAFLDWVRAFRPDPLWQRVPSCEPGRSDFQLVLAEANHRHWVDRVIACSHGQPAEEPLAMDYRQCRFGQWYYGKGMTRYGKRKDYLALGDRHREIHELAERLRALAKTDRVEERDAVERKLYASRERLVERLKRMRWASMASPALVRSEHDKQ
jgi:diguanylate cyclase (GGDEF)-like protein/PAS domain S-box-containing protein